MQKQYFKEYSPALGRDMEGMVYGHAGRPVINMLIGFFMGLSSGAGVVISQYYGAHKEEEVQKTVHTAIVMTLIMGVVFTAIGLAMTPFMLRLMNTPENVLPESTAYLTIYFSGKNNCFSF